MDRSPEELVFNEIAWKEGYRFFGSAGFIRRDEKTSKG